MKFGARILGAAAVTAITASTFSLMPTAAHAAAQDYRVPGVRIFEQATAGSKVQGLGYPGQGLFVMDSVTSEPYTCDNGVTSTTWYYQSNNTTKVRGWIPACNYTGHA